ncbi:MAG: restriction endonuclease subunit S [Patescibacteria group bacterium]|jgi:restriction endonuclease S subunit
MKTNWPIKKIGELLKTKPQYGFTAKASLQEKPYLYLRITDINDSGMLNLANPKFIDTNEVTFKKYALENDDILIARSGSVGRMYLVNKTDLPKPALFASYLIRFKLDKNKVLPKFFFLYSLSPYYKNFISRTLNQVTQPNINAQQYSNLEIPIPPLQIQKQIVAKIEKYFEKIDKAIVLRQKSLVGTNQIFCSSLKKVLQNISKKNKMIEFSECIKKLPKKIKGIAKTNYYREGNYPIVDQGASLIGGYTNDKYTTYQGELPVIIFGDHTRIFKYIDFVFAIGADGTKIIDPKDEFNPKYFYYALQDLDLESLGYSRHYKILKKERIPLPSISEQKKIVAYLNNLREKVEKLKTLQQNQLADLSSLKQSILSSAFEGEL